MSLPRKKLLLAVVVPLLTLSLSLSGLPGTVGTASAALKLNNKKDDQKVKDYCKKKLPDGAGQNKIGACYEGYVLGLRAKYYGSFNDYIESCNRDFNSPGVVYYCRSTGYNGGYHNSAGTTHRPSRPSGGSPGSVAAGSADICGGNVGHHDYPSVGISIDIGCRNKGNPIADMAFAIIRILSYGVGLVVVGSIVVGGIQYSASRGDPQATAQAVNRIRSSLYALLIFIFGYALLNYIIPGAILR